MPATELPRVGTRVEARRPAVREHREAPRVQAALDRDPADQVGHLRVDDLDDPRGGLLRLEAQGLADPAADGLDRRPAIEAHPPPEEVVGIDPAEHEVRVGHGRLGPARAVAGRAGRCPGAPRPDLQHPRFRLDPGDAPAAGADRGDVDDRHGDRILGEHRRLGIPRLAVDDRADVEARPAHVRGDRRVEPETPGERAGAQHSAGRPGGEQRDASVARLVERRHAARRVHDRNRTGVSRVAKAISHPLQVAAHARGEVGVQHRRRGALVLADHRRQVAGGGYKPVRTPVAVPPQPVAQPPLVVGIEKRPQEADRNRLDTLLAQPGGQALQPLELQRSHDRAARVDPLVDPVDARPRHERIGLGQSRDVDDLALGQSGDLLDRAPDDDRVLVPPRRQEGRTRAGAGDEDVRGDRRAVGEEPRVGQEVRQRQAEAAGRLADGAQHPLLEAGRRGRGLRPDEAALVVHDDAVGEGAPAVDRDDEAHGPLTSACRPACTDSSQAGASRASSRIGSWGRAISTSSSVKQPGQ